MLDSIYKVFYKFKKNSAINKLNTANKNKNKNKTKTKNKESLNKTKNNDDKNMEQSENLMGKKQDLLEKIVSRQTRRNIEKEL